MKFMKFMSLVIGLFLLGACSSRDVDVLAPVEYGDLVVSLNSDYVSKATSQLVDKADQIIFMLKHKSGNQNPGYVHRIVQSKTDANFGVINLKVPVGEYDLYCVANKSFNTASVEWGSESFVEELDGYLTSDSYISSYVSKIYDNKFDGGVTELTVNTSKTTTVSALKLMRVSGGIEFNITGSDMSSVSKLDIQHSKSSYYPESGIFGGNTIKLESRVFDVRTGFNTYTTNLTNDRSLLLYPGEVKLNLIVGDKIYPIKGNSELSLVRNRKMVIHGDFDNLIQSDDYQFTIEIDDTWLGEDLVEI